MIEGKEINVSKGAVATEAAEAARIGARILGRGGNAMDAAAAACLACSILIPYYVDIGGYACSGVVLEGDRKSTRLNSSHIPLSRMPSSA